MRVKDLTDKKLYQQMHKAQREIKRRKRTIGMLSQGLAENRKQFEGVCGRWDRLNKEAERREQDA